MKKLNKPVVGKTYTLTYFGFYNGRFSPIHSYKFECLKRRGGLWHFFSHDKGIDLVLNTTKFNTYLNNTVESLQNQNNNGE